MQSKNKLKRTILFGLITSFSLISVFSVSAFSNVNIQKKNNDILSLKNEQVNFTFNNSNESVSLEERFNMEFESLTVEYKDKEKTAINSLDKSKIVFKNYQTNLYKVQLVDTLKVPGFPKTVWVVYKLIDKKTGEESRLDHKTLSGFLTEDEEKKYKEVEELIKNLSINVKNKANIYPKDVKIEDIILNGYNEDEIWVRVSKLIVDPTNWTLFVQIESWKNEDSSVRYTKGFFIEGFKKDHVTDEEFETEASKVMYLFEDKENTLLDTIEDETMFKASGYNDKKFSTKIRTVTLDKTNSKAYIEYELIEINSGKTSELKLFIIEGFKTKGEKTDGFVEPTELIKISVFDGDKHTDPFDFDTKILDTIFGFTISVENIIKRADYSILVKYKLTKNSETNL